MGTAPTRSLAVVTGASSGIGLELARQCVEHDFDLVICSNDASIQIAADHLSGAGASVQAVRADLATFEGCETLVETIEATHRPVDALLLNAGRGVGGEFITTDLDDELRMIALNCGSVVHLAKRLVPAMVARKSGRILITASVASTSPTPFISVYGATKAFDLSFAEALRYELSDSGVTVTALQPGATETEFFARADMEDTKVAQGKKDDPADVAKEGFDAMMAGEDKVIAASFRSTIEGLVGELLPEPLKARIQASASRPGSAHRS
ncbi:MAG TPA: SDR family NAD(P)-dependent oxidoreductase [Kofleriaceae bacterium]|jgi:short-subunit dehydrogenase|nr:SDR family NAD(P)-dependent oxidoreductase [Kofleriaceae bacterium]